MKTCASREYQPARSNKRSRSALAAAVFLLMSMTGAAWALPLTPLQSSTNPGNGDQNPYGVLYVPPGFPTTTVQPGNILVSNFNDGANNQGQGTTIINIRQDHTRALFAKVTPPGLTAALGILQAGFVLVGSITVPKPSNFPAAVGGPITVLDANGKLVTTISGSLIDGPWYMAIDDHGTTAFVWVSNVLNGTVTRINVGTTPSFHVISITRIAQNYGAINTIAHPLIGAAGLAYSRQNHVLYVANGQQRVFAVANADTLTAPVSLGTEVYHDAVHLHGALGLALAPNGDLISAQNDGIDTNPAMPSEIVEFTPNPNTNPTGVFVTQVSIDSQLGAAFNIAIAQNSDPLVPLSFAYVDDAENTLVQFFLPTFQVGFGNSRLVHK
jgi:hypothetical protein